MLIGYARVSTIDQSLELQLDALKQAGCEKIEIDKVGGATADREGLNKVLDFLREGDTIIVWRLDRLGRSLKHLIEVINDLEKRGVFFKSITEAIDTTTSSGKLIFHMFAALAEFERNLIKERTKAGLAAGRARGRLGGRPKKLEKEKREHVANLYNERKLSVKQICKLMGISKPTVYAYLRG